MSVALSIKNVPPKLVSALQARAARNHRSMQGELMHILELAVEEEKQQRNERPFDLKGLLKRLDRYPLPRSRNESTAWVRKDRDSR